jgi:hypothetical protein
MSSFMTFSARPRASSGTSSVVETRWLGTVSAVASNQKTDSAVSTLPLSGIGVGCVTSYVEIRSLATISRRSPRSYSSRTLPEATRGRSASVVGTRRRLATGTAKAGCGLRCRGGRAYAV